MNTFEKKKKIKKQTNQLKHTAKLNNMKRKSSRILIVLLWILFCVFIISIWFRIQDFLIRNAAWAQNSWNPNGIGVSVWLNLIYIWLIEFDLKVQSEAWTSKLELKTSRSTIITITIWSGEKLLNTWLKRCNQSQQNTKLSF